MILLVSLYILFQILFAAFVIIMSWVSSWTLTASIVVTVIASIEILFNACLLFAGYDNERNHTLE